jgi:hypothetical protein
MLLALIVTFIFFLIPWIYVHKKVTNQKKLFKRCGSWGLHPIYFININIWSMKTLPWILLFNYNCINFNTKICLRFFLG